MSGKRLLVGIIVTGVLVPLTLFFLLGLETIGQFFTIEIGRASCRERV